MTHGHEVIKMMLDSGLQYTKQSLRAAIHEKFGESARFYTCAAENMTADELITFLAERGKFIDLGEQFSFNSQKMCDHQ